MGMNEGVTVQEHITKMKVLRNQLAMVSQAGEVDQDG